MSGSGGFYKYRCKHFLTYNCNNWVYVNGAACACCLVRSSTGTPLPWVFKRSFLLNVPLHHHLYDLADIGSSLH